MKKIIIFIVSVLAFFALLILATRAAGQKVNLEVSAGLNERTVLTAGLGITVRYKNVFTEANFYAVGFHGQNEPATFGGRIGYQVFKITPTIGRYFVYMSADKTNENYWSNLYGLRYDRRILFFEADYTARQYLFLIGVKL